jgi:VWFA-related protein
MLRFPPVRATRLGLAAAAILAALVTTPRPGRAQTPPTFPSQVELVTVDAIVLSEKGRPVRGLTREDFALSEDGKPQEIVSFEAFDGAEAAEEAPSDASPVASNARVPDDRAGAFVLLVDDLGIDARRLPRLLEAVSGMLQSSFRAGDEVTLVTASGSLWWGIRFPEGRDDLPFLLGRATSRRLPELGNDFMTDYEAYQIANHERLMVGTDPSASEFPTYLGRVVRRWMGTAGCLSNRLASCAQAVQARAIERDSERRTRTLAILAAVERAVFSLTGVRGRKELLLFSDGFVSDRDLPELRQVAGICREANVVVSFLDARGSLPALPEMQASFARPPDPVDMGAAALEQRGDEIAGALGLTEDTGGVAVSGQGDFGAATRRIVDESRVYYMLGYQPPPGKGPRDWRKLKVDVNRPGTTVRARKGYTLRPQGTAEATLLARYAKEKDKGDKADKGARARNLEVTRALLATHDQGALPMRALPYLVDEGTSGKMRVRMALELDEAMLFAGMREGAQTTIDLAVQAAHRDSADVFREHKRFTVSYPSSRPLQWAPFYHELDLAPGVAQVRVVVRDAASRRVGTVTTRIEIPPLSGLRLATPILTDELLAPLEKGVRPQLLIPAHRTFRTTTGSLYCQIKVLGAVPSSPDGGAPQVEASYVLRRAGGTVVDRSAPSLISAVAGGPIVRLLGLPLGGLADGDYELVLRAFDRTTGSGVERVESFRLEGR